VLILAAPDTALASQAAGIKGVLEREGHEVVVAQSPDELSHRLHEHPTDIVLTHWSDAASTDQLLAAGADSPTVVPIAFADKDAAAAKAEGADRCLARSDQKRGRKLVEKIDNILEQTPQGGSVRMCDHDCEQDRLTAVAFLSRTLRAWAVTVAMAALLSPGLASAQAWLPDKGEFNTSLAISDVLNKTTTRRAKRQRALLTRSTSDTHGRRLTRSWRHTD
jgi:CheY-like chemotaxis protein